MLKTDFENYDDVIDYVTDLVNSTNFTRTLELAQAILDEPDQYTGPQAAVTAIKLATHRLKIGIAAQQAKITSAQTKKLEDRLSKDALMVAYDAMGEIINTLKLTARHDHELAK